MKYVSPLLILSYHLSKDGADNTINQYSLHIDVSKHIKVIVKYTSKNLDAQGNFITLDRRVSSIQIFFNERSVYDRTCHTTDYLLSKSGTFSYTLLGDQTIINSGKARACLVCSKYLDPSFKYSSLYNVLYPTDEKEISYPSPAWAVIETKDHVVYLPNLATGKPSSIFRYSYGSSNALIGIMSEVSEEVNLLQDLQEKVDKPLESKIDHHIELFDGEFTQPLVTEDNSINADTKITNGAAPSKKSVRIESDLFRFGVPMRIGGKTIFYYPSQNGAEYDGIKLSKEESYKCFVSWYFLMYYIKMNTSPNGSDSMGDFYQDFLALSKGILWFVGIYQDGTYQIDTVDVDYLFSNHKEAIDFFLQNSILGVNHILALLDSGCNVFALAAMICKDFQNFGFINQLTYHSVFEQVAYYILATDSPGDNVFDTTPLLNEDQLIKNLNWIPNTISLVLPLSVDEFGKPSDGGSVKSFKIDVTFKTTSSLDDVPNGNAVFAVKSNLNHFIALSKTQDGIKVIYDALQKKQGYTLRSDKPEAFRFAEYSYAAYRLPSYSSLNRVGLGFHGWSALYKESLYFLSYSQSLLQSSLASQFKVRVLNYKGDSSLSYDRGLVLYPFLDTKERAFGTMQLPACFRPAHLYSGFSTTILRNQMSQLFPGRTARQFGYNPFTSDLTAEAVKLVSYVTSVDYLCLLFAQVRTGQKTRFNTPQNDKATTSISPEWLFTDRPPKYAMKPYTIVVGSTAQGLIDDLYNMSSDQNIINSTSQMKFLDKNDYTPIESQHYKTPWSFNEEPKPKEIPNRSGFSF